MTSTPEILTLGLKAFSLVLKINVMISSFLAHCSPSTAAISLEEEILTLADSQLETLQEKRNLLIKDLEKFKMLIDNLNKHLVDVEKKTVEIKADAAAKEIELKSAEVEKAELQDVVGQ